MLRALDVALLQLTDSERSLLHKKYFLGSSVREIAEKLNVTPKTVESRLTRARVELRRHLLVAYLRHDQEV